MLGLRIKSKLHYFILINLILRALFIFRSQKRSQKSQLLPQALI